MSDVVEQPVTNGNVTTPAAMPGFFARRFNWRGVHRWISFLITAQLLVVTITGVLLLFRAEIDRLVSPELYRITPGALPLETVRATIAKDFPERTVQSIALPTHERPILIVGLSGNPRMQVIVDPGSGAVLGTRDPGASVNGFILDLHRRLAAGKVGDVIIGISGVLLTVALISGSWLWLRSSRRWKLGLRKDKGGGILVYDIHRVTGVVALPIGLLIAVTGVVLAYPAVLRAFAPAAQEQKSAQQLEPKPTPSWDVLRETGGEATTFIGFPRKPGEQITLRLEGGSMRWLDSATGAEVRRQDGRTLHGWMLPLHSGAVGGTTATMLYVITAVGILTLAITGVWWWWFRRFGKAVLADATPVPGQSP